MEIKKADLLVKKYCSLNRKHKGIMSEKSREAWLAYEEEYKQWAGNATKEEREYFKKFIDPEWIGMTCNGIRYMREQEKQNSKR